LFIIENNVRAPQRTGGEHGSDWLSRTLID
jgi:hypothetical protein